MPDFFRAGGLGRPALLTVEMHNNPLVAGRGFRHSGDAARAVVLGPGQVFDAERRGREILLPITFGFEVADRPRQFDESAGAAEPQPAFASEGQSQARKPLELGLAG